MAAVLTRAEFDERKGADTREKVKLHRRTQTVQEVAHHQRVPRNNNHLPQGGTNNVIVRSGRSDMIPPGNSPPAFVHFSGGVA